MDSTIIEVYAFGNKKVRFQPVSSFETEDYFDEKIKQVGRGRSTKYIKT